MTRKDDKRFRKSLATITNSRNADVTNDNGMASSGKKTTKERVTIQLPVDLIEKARDVVYFTPGLTMTRLMEEALVATLEEMARKRGGRFESRGNARLRTGRPVKKFSGN
jgi:post-segregation antitoxin (ccd killing protein)